MHQSPLQKGDGPSSLQWQQQCGTHSLWHPCMVLQTAYLGRWLFLKDLAPKMQCSLLDTVPGGTTVAMLGPCARIGAQDM